MPPYDLCHFSNIWTDLSWKPILILSKFNKIRNHLSRVKRKHAFEHAQNGQVLFILCITRAFALHSYIL